MTAITISDQEYRDFSRFLESQCGIVLGDSKQYLVRSRLSLRDPHFFSPELSRTYRFEASYG